MSHSHEHEPTKIEVDYQGTSAAIIKLSTELDKSFPTSPYEAAELIQDIHGGVQ